MVDECWIHDAMSESETFLGYLAGTKVYYNSAVCGLICGLLERLHYYARALHVSHAYACSHSYYKLKTWQTMSIFDEQR